MTAKKYNAMTMTEENPLYVKYLKKKTKFVKGLRLSSEYADKDDYNAYIYLCFVTRLFFRDNLLICLAKLGFGIGAIITSVLMEFFAKPIILKAPIMVGLLLYGFVMIPLSILYFIANFICYLQYLEYVTTAESTMAKRIIVFYDDETDKFQAVNWRSVFRRDKNDYVETKRKRGW